MKWKRMGRDNASVHMPVNYVCFTIIALAILK